MALEIAAAVMTGSVAAIDSGLVFNARLDRRRTRCLAPGANLVIELLQLLSDSV